MPTIPVPPADLSGGYMVINATNGVDTHRYRIHLSPFNAPGGSGVAFTYNPVVGSGAEVNFNDTFAAYAALLAPYYKTTWAFSVLALFQNVSGTIAEVFGWPIPATVAGTRTDAEAAFQDRALMLNLNFKTTKGGRARFTVIGAGALSGGANLAPRVPTSGTDPLSFNLAQYLKGANCAVVGHDGAKLSAYGPRDTVVINKKLRRRYGYA